MLNLPRLLSPLTLTFLAILSSAIPVVAQSLSEEAATFANKGWFNKAAELYQKEFETVSNDFLPWKAMSLPQSSDWGNPTYWFPDDKVYTNKHILSFNLKGTNALAFSLRLVDLKKNYTSLYGTRLSLIVSSITRSNIGITNEEDTKTLERRYLRTLLSKSTNSQEYDNAFPGVKPTLTSKKSFFAKDELTSAADLKDILVNNKVGTNNEPFFVFEQVSLGNYKLPLHFYFLPEDDSTATLIRLEVSVKDNPQALAFVSREVFQFLDLVRKRNL